MSRTFMVLLIAGIIASTPAHLTAQQAEEETTENQTEVQETTPEGAPVFTDQVVITASRREQGSATTPAPSSTSSWPTASWVKFPPSSWHPHKIW